MKLGGLVTAAVGIGVMVLLHGIANDEGPVYLAGLIPLLIGLALLAYAFVLAPKDARVREGIVMLSDVANVKEKTISRTTFGSTLGRIVAWAWAMVAAGGGGRLAPLDKRATAAERQRVGSAPAFRGCGLSGNKSVL